MSPVLVLGSVFLATFLGYLLVERVDGFRFALMGQHAPTLRRLTHLGLRYAVPFSIVAFTVAIASDNVQLRRVVRHPDLARHTSFLLDAEQRIEKLSKLVQHPRPIDTEVHVRAVELFRWPQLGEMTCADVYEIEAVEGQSATRFHALVGAATDIQHFGDLSPTWYYKGPGQTDWQQMQSDELLVTRDPDWDRGSAFDVQFPLSKDLALGPAAVKLVYRWPWRKSDLPPMVSFFDPRIYPAGLDQAWIHLAVDHPLEFMLTPRFDPASDQFDLASTLNPGSTFSALGNGRNASSVVTRMLGRSAEQTPFVYCLGTESVMDRSHHGLSPVALVYREAQQQLIAQE